MKTGSRGRESGSGATVRGHIVGHIRPQTDANRRGQTQKAPFFFLGMTVRSSQTQLHAKDW